MSATTSAPTASPSRPLRRDAARNRQALMDAAREVFGSRGLEATLDDIAHAAGVGVGTAYRHFANKQELAAALFADDFSRMVELAQDATEIADPWLAIEGFVESVVAMHAADRGFYEVFAGLIEDGRPTIMFDDDKMVALREALTTPVTELVDRGKAAGCLRPDLEPSDVAAIFLMMGEVYVLSETTERPMWRRYLRLLLDGLRATACGPLPGTALDFTELDRALRAVKQKKHQH